MASGKEVLIAESDVDCCRWSLRIGHVLDVALVHRRKVERRIFWKYSLMLIPTWCSSTGQEEGMEGGMVTHAPALVRFAGVQKTYDGETWSCGTSTSTSGAASSSRCSARRARARPPR